MKLYFKEKVYRHWSGLVLHGPGEVEVSEEMGEYLVKTFPNWFEIKEEEVKAEPKETKKPKKSRKK